MYKMYDYDQTLQKNDNKCSNYILAYLIVQALNYYVKLVFTDFRYWPLISKGILAIFLCKALSVILKKNLSKFVLIEMTVVASFAYTYVLGDFNKEAIAATVLNAIIVFIPLSFCILCIRDYNLFLKRLYNSSWVIILILIAIVLQIKSSSIYEYNMPLSYALMLQLLIISDHFIYSKRKIDLIACIVIFFCILIVGSRGPILCIALYFAIMFLFSKRFTSAQKFVALMIVTIVCIIIFSNLDHILLWLIKSLNKYGFSSRSLYYLYERNYSDSGRADIYSTYLLKAKDGPLFGYGLAGGWINSHYPHNILIELVLSYGLVLGCAFSILYILLIVNGLRVKNSYKRRLAFIFISYSANLLMSNSFVLDPIFYITIALCV